MSAEYLDDRSITAILADLTGWPVRQLHDERRLVGVPGWRVVVRCFEVRDTASLAKCWRDAAAAGELDCLAPALLFRAGPDEWRAIWPAALQLIEQERSVWTDYEWTVEAAVPVWAAATREIADSAAEDQRV